MYLLVCFYIQAVFIKCPLHCVTPLVPFSPSSPPLRRKAYLLGRLGEDTERLANRVRFISAGEWQ